MRAQVTGAEHRVLAAGGVELYAIEVGRPDAQPLVFIHGASQSHLCWRKQLESDLASEFRLIAFDLRGHG